jgi:CRP/FNR family transcriptional regulator, anaerobic regulatory protein
MGSIIPNFEDNDGFELLFLQLESKVSKKLTTEEKLLIRGKMRQKVLRRRQYVLQEGNVCRSISFLIGGTGRLLSIDDKGLEHTLTLSVEGEWITDYESFHWQTSSKYYLEIMEKSKLLLLNHADYQHLTGVVPIVRDAMRLIELDHHIACLHRLHSAISLSAWERYDLLKRGRPDFVRRFPQATLASFLGISAETLCRVRRQKGPFLS